MRKLVRAFVLAIFIASALAAFFAGGSTPLMAEEKEKPPHAYYMPVVVHPDPPAVKSATAVTLVNDLRTEADIPPVQESPPLNENCYEHARYMAENNVLAHEQDPRLPYASESGQDCAENANAWLGSNRYDTNWTPKDSVNVWMKSVAHRIWLLYPTTRTVGYGFFSVEEDHRAAAAFDILSSANFEADRMYGGWPVKYPVGDLFVPATRYPITLNWRYFGPKPVVQTVQLQTADGQILAHEANTNLPAGHKGIQIIPQQDLPPHSQITVTVSGSYEGQPFSYTWDFHTGSPGASAKLDTGLVSNQ